MPPLGFRRCVLRRGYCVIELEELLDPRYLHGVANALRDADQGQGASFLPSDA